MTLKRKTPLRAKKRIQSKAAKPKPRKPIKKTNPKRRKKRFADAFGGEDRVAFVQALPCIVCWKRPSEVAHIRSRGAGGKAADTVPLCKTHHAEQHAVGVKTFAAKYELDLPNWAAWTEENWQHHLRSTK